MKRLLALAFVLVLAPSAFGQILFDNVTSGTITGTTLTINHTIGGGSNRLLVLQIAVEGNNVANSALTATPTFNGVPFNLAIENVTGTSFGMRTLIYYMLETGLPGAGTYAVSITAANADDISAGVVSVTAAEQQPPEVTGSNDDGQTGASTIQTIITTLTNGAWIFDCVGSGNAVSGFTPDAGQTERWDVAAASSRGAGSTREEPTAGAVTMGWIAGSTSNRISHVVAAWAAFVPCVTDGDCDDANACTDDTCGAGATCQHVINNANPCDDGDLCTSSDVCIAGSCVGIFDPACSATGFQSPSSTAARQGPWTAPTNAFASNNTYAKSGTSSTAQQDWTNFGLSLPTAATVDGIEVRIEHRHKKDTDRGFYTCQLIDGGGLLGLAKDGPDHGHRAEAIEILPSAGGPTDTWGTVLTDAVVESPAFGISCHYTATTPGGGNKLDVDHLQIIVYFTPECAVASDCDDGNQCTFEVCVSQSCQNGPLPNGTTCNDGDVCVVGETCQAGVCGSGAPADCSGAGDQCNTASCDTLGENEGNCDILTPANEGLSCDDSVFCNGVDTCNAGSCVSTGDPCLPLTCDEIGDVCLPAATVDGLELFYSGRFADAADPSFDFLAVGSISDSGNVSNYMRGITGIRVFFDTTITFATTPAAAFSFEWTTGEGTVFTPITDAATNVTVTALDSGGTTTVTIIITDDHVRKRWLKVSIDSAQVTGNGVALDGEMSGNAVLLPSGDSAPGGDAVFFIGNQPGDVDASATTLLTDMGIMVPNVNPFRAVPITNIFDVDKNGMVLLADLGQARLDVDIFFELPVISP